MKDIHAILKRYYGYNSFRDGQEQIINTILSGKDILALLPTGGGKSICFQIPALSLPGVAIVISPLISLMKDQVDTLNQKGIKATYLNSSLNKDELNTREEKIAKLDYKLIYVAPERLKSKKFQNLANLLPVHLIAVDESHCISQWGHDFRPSYLEIANFVKKLEERPPIAAFTATANKKICKDIKKHLNLRNPTIYSKTFYRDNLAIQINKVDEHEKELILVEKLLRINRESGTSIIFCDSRRGVENIYELIKQHGLNTQYYHAGLSSQQRRQIQEDFMNDKYKFIICTNAFGMGIDKPDVRNVIHFGFSNNLESYYQEAGRAGRDGEYAECQIIYSVTDIRKKQIQLKDKYPNKENLKLLLKYLYSFINKTNIEANLIELKDLTGATINQVKTLLLFLEQNQVIDCQYNNLKVRINLKRKVNASKFSKHFRKQGWLFKREKKGLESIFNFLQTEGCRMKTILQHFDEKFQVCKKCDNCTNKNLP